MPINIDELSEEELIDLNRKIVERLRLMHQVHAHQEMFKFKIGDKVTFKNSLWLQPWIRDRVSA